VVVHPLVAWLRRPLDLIPPQTELPVLIGPLRGARWIVGSGNHVAWMGLYELHKHQRFAATIRPGSIVYDIGAHAGFYTLLASRLVGPQGRVVAFEPLRTNTTFLCRHLRINHATNVQIYEVAVWSCTSTISFDDTSGSSYTGRVSQAGRISVPTIALDDLISSGKAPPPDYIKIDIEGAELEALRGAAVSLERYRPLIFLATHELEVHRECLQLLSELGYRIIPLHRGRDTLQTDELVAFHPRVADEV
jgi:FkbM family methyltransferase